MTAQMKLAKTHQAANTYAISAREAERLGVPVIVMRSPAAVARMLQEPAFVPPTPAQMRDAKMRALALEIRQAKERGVKQGCRLTMKKVALRTGFLFSELTEKCREQDRVAARYRAFWGMRAGTDWTWPDIARFFGLNHTTILHGVRKHTALTGKTLPDRNSKKK